MTCTRVFFNTYILGCNDQWFHSLIFFFKSSDTTQTQQTGKPFENVYMVALHTIRGHSVEVDCFGSFTVTKNQRIKKQIQYGL